MDQFFFITTDVIAVVMDINSPGSPRPDFPRKSPAWNFRGLLENKFFFVLTLLIFVSLPDVNVFTFLVVTKIVYKNN